MSPVKAVTLNLAVSLPRGARWNPWRGSRGPYLPPGLVVVQVHECPCVLLDLPGIHKDFGEANPVSDVGRAASPFPAFLFVVLSLLLFVAAAVAQVALRAGGRDRMCHASRDDGVRERRFPATCNSNAAVNT